MIAQALAETEIDPDQAVMIGDTSYDMAMARAAGVTSIGVAWGYHSPDELKEAGADHLVYRPADLLEIVRSAQ
jgi:phosphoglycolate phosphatase